LRVGLAYLSQTFNKLTYYLKNDRNLCVQLTKYILNVSETPCIMVQFYVDTV